MDVFKCHPWIKGHQNNDLPIENKNRMETKFKGIELANRRIKPVTFHLLEVLHGTLKALLYCNPAIFPHYKTL